MHREPVQVTFADADIMGHVNHAQYFTYFETARTNYYFRLRGIPPPWRADQLDIIVAKATCEYRRAVRWGEDMEVVVWPHQVGRTSFTFVYELRDRKGEVAARGETVQVLFDYARNEKKALPDDLRRALEAERPTTTPAA